MTKEGDEEDGRKDVLEAIHEEKMDYPCFLDQGGAWSKQASVAHIPAFVVLDRAGRVAYRFAGKLLEGSSAFEELANAITKALSTPKPS